MYEEIGTRRWTLYAMLALATFGFAYLSHQSRLAEEVINRNEEQSSITAQFVEVVRFNQIQGNARWTLTDSIKVQDTTHIRHFNIIFTKDWR